MQVDMITKVSHTLAHAVRLCSVQSEECMFYGQSDVQENIALENFEVSPSGLCKLTWRSSFSGFLQFLISIFSTLVIEFDKVNQMNLSISEPVLRRWKNLARSQVSKVTIVMIQVCHLLKKQRDFFNQCAEPSTQSLLQPSRILTTLTRSVLHSKP